MTRYSSGRHTLPSRFHFPRPALLFTIASTLLVGGKFLFEANWPLFWPLSSWLLVVAVHYFISGAFDIDEEWIKDKAREIKARSYDFDHIGNIEQRFEQRDPSVTHPVERTD